MPEEREEIEAVSTGEPVLTPPDPGTEAIVSEQAGHKRPIYSRSGLFLVLALVFVGLGYVFGGFLFQFVASFFMSLSVGMMIYPLNILLNIINTISIFQ